MNGFYIYLKIMCNKEEQLSQFYLLYRTFDNLIIEIDISTVNVKKEIAAVNLI